MNILHKIVKIALGLGVIFFTVSQVQAAQINVPADQPTIQAAVGIAADGDTIMISDGTYTENIVVDKPVTIRSANGSAVTAVQASDTSKSGFRINSDHVTIQGFTISGVAIEGPAAIYISNGVQHCTITENQIGTSAASNAYGIYLREASNNTISDNICEANSNYGIVFYRSNNNAITGNVCASSGVYGIYLYESSNNTLENNQFTDSATAGASLWASNDNLLTSNTFTGNIGRGFYMNGSSTGNRITDNTFTENNTAIQIYASHSNTISKNLCQTNGVSAITIMDSSSDNNISDNICDDHEFGAGIKLVDSDLNRISNNTLSHNSEGIGLQNASANQIFSNHSFENSDGGIVLSAGSQFNAVYSNQSHNNSGGGIKIYDSTNNRIWDNICDTNGQSSIFIFNSSDNMLMRNTFSGSTFGMLLNASNDNAIYLNNIKDNTSFTIISVDSVNVWQTPQAMTYFFESNPYSSFLGNFHDDHIWVDLDGNGLTDEPKNLPNDEQDDNYPLVMGHENFIVNPGNLDHDAEVDGFDLVKFVVAFENNIIAADLNQNNVSDIGDVEIFAANFGKDI